MSRLKNPPGKAVLLVDGGYVDKLEELWLGKNPVRQYRWSTHILDFERFNRDLGFAFDVEVVSTHYYHAKPLDRRDRSKSKRLRAAHEMSDCRQRFGELKRLGVRVVEGRTTSRDYRGQYTFHLKTDKFDEATQQVTTVTQTITKSCRHPRIQQKEVDSCMIVDMMRMHYEEPDINTYFIFSGDTDMKPALNFLISRGANVVVILQEGQVRQQKGLGRGRWKMHSIRWDQIERKYLSPWKPRPPITNDLNQ